MEISAELLAEQLAAIEAGKTTFREAADRLARTLAPTTGEFPAISTADTLPPTASPSHRNEITLVVRSDHPQVLRDALEFATKIAVHPAFSLANQHPPHVSLDPTGRLTYRFPRWYSLPRLGQQLPWPPPSHLVQLWTQQLRQIDQLCLENQWKLNLAGWDDFYVDSEGHLQFPLISLRLAEAKLTRGDAENSGNATQSGPSSLAVALIGQLNSGAPQNGTWVDVMTTPADAETAPLKETDFSASEVATVQKGSKHDRRPRYALATAIAAGLGTVAAGFCWWNYPAPTEITANVPPSSLPAVEHAAPLQSIAERANQHDLQSDNVPVEAEQIGPEVERLLAAPLPEIIATVLPTNKTDALEDEFGKTFAVDAANDTVAASDGAGRMPANQSAQLDQREQRDQSAENVADIKQASPLHAPAILLPFQEDRRTLTWTLATVPNLRRCAATLQVLSLAALSQDAAKEQGGANEVVEPAYRWLLTFAEQSGRIPRGLLELSESDASDVRVRIRFDLRLARQVQLSVRQAATIDGGQSWIPASETNIVAMIDQVTAQRVAIESQLKNLRSLYDLAERTETRKALRRRRSELEELETWSQQALARMAELRQLVARIETMLAVELRVAEQPSEANDQPQIILATDQRDGA